MDKEIDKHIIKGLISCWKFNSNKNFSGWNFSANETGNASLIEVLSKMIESEWPSKKEILLTIPEENDQNWVKNVGSYCTPVKLIISNIKTPLNKWELTFINNELILYAGNKKIIELLENLSKNTFDGGISDENGNNLLTFW